MKRTTYILIGLFVAGLCVLVGGMFMIFCLGRPYISNQLNLQGVFPASGGKQPYSALRRLHCR